jgi:hypothetical protein
MAFTPAERIPRAALLFYQKVVEHPQRRQMLLNGRIGHTDVRPFAGSGWLHQVAKICTDCFLPDLVWFLASRAEESQVSFQIAAVGIQRI